ELLEHGCQRAVFGRLDSRALGARLANVAVPLGGRALRGGRGRGLALGRLGDLAHETGVVATDEQFRLFGERLEERVEPFGVDLGEIAEHMVGDEVLGAGVADADANAPVVLAAMRVEGLDAVMSAGTATLL